jgi:predicted peroxiredoxin
MQTETDKLVILVTKGIDPELSSVAFTIANGGLTAGLKVSIFLTSAAIDLVRRGGQRLTHVAHSIRWPNPSRTSKSGAA